MYSINYVLFILVFLFISCDNKENSITKVGVENSLELEYPRIIDSLNLEKHYDEAKWILYSYHAQDSCLFPIAIESEKNEQPKSFSEKGLKFLDVRQKKDTIEIYFDFTFKEDIPCRLFDKDFTVDGAAFLINDPDSFLYLTKGLNGNAIPQNPKEFKESLIDSSLINFVKQNYNSVNPWYREEGNLRGYWNNEVY